MQKPVVIILAGGANSRFWPLREKSLYRFMDEPLLTKQMNVYRDAGFEEFIVIANPGNRDMIAALVGKEADVAVQSAALGMGHAILQAYNYLAAKDFPPIYVCQVNDVVEAALHQKLMDAYQSGSAASYLAGFTVSDYFPGGYLSVEGDSRIRGLVEKPGAGNEPSDLVNIVAHVHTETKALIDAIDGLYAAKHPSDDHYEVAMARLMQDMRFECVRYEGRWHPIKYPWQVLDVTHFYLSQIDGQHVHPQAKLYSEVTILGNVIIEVGAKIFPGAAIVGPAYIGANTVVGNGALVRESHIGPGCVIGHTSEVARSYLERQVNLHRAVVLDSVFEENVNFSAGCVTANLRIDGGTIKSIVKGERIDSGRDKLGAMVGANTFIGIQSGTMPGVKLGANSEVGAFTNVVSDLPEGTRRYAIQTYEETRATGKI
ncbi:MAG: NTP transferase domain-containing protein [Chloroflexi bacterium]|nr:NTP transferase domain-containing protein [Chloroflexota bacterium]